MDRATAHLLHTADKHQNEDGEILVNCVRDDFKYALWMNHVKNPRFKAIEVQDFDGLSLELPTAGDIVVSQRVNANTVTRLLQVQNQAVHVAPFLAYVYTPDDRFFSQSFMQFDFNAKGNPVRFLNTTNGNLESAGVWNAATFDQPFSRNIARVSAGRW